VGATAGLAGGLAMRRLFSSSRPTTLSIELNNIMLNPVINGALADTSPVSSSSLWRQSGAVVFVVRRPG